MSAAERLLDLLRDLLFAWTHRLTAHQTPSARMPRDPRVPRIDLGALVDRHQARRTPTSGNAVAIRERVTMHDHAVSRLFDRRDNTPPSHWPG